MAHEQLGSIAHRIVLIGDPRTQQGQTSQINMLDAALNIERLAVAQSLDVELARLRAAGESLHHKMTLRRQRRLARSIERQAASRLRQWVALGLRDRITVWSLSGPARALLNVAVAALDFYVFAKAFANSESAPDGDLLHPSYLLGGALGLVVFLAGLILARMIKEQIMHAAQRSIRDERIKESGTGSAETPPVGTTSKRLLGLVLGIYLLLTIAGFLVRWSGLKGNAADFGAAFAGGTKSWGQWAGMLLQTLVPLVTVALEVAVHDPLDPQGLGKVG